MPFRGVALPQEIFYHSRRFLGIFFSENVL